MTFMSLRTYTWIAIEHLRNSGLSRFPWPAISALDLVNSVRSSDWSLPTGKRS